MVWTAEAYYKKRYEAGLKAGCAKGRAEIRDKVEKFFEEHPDATAAQLREFLINRRDDNRPKAVSD